MSNSYVVKPVPPSDLEAACQIWSTAFLQFATTRDRQLEYAREILSCLVGAYEGKTLVSVAGVIDFDMHFGDRWVPCGGIAAVATTPSHRRHGAVKATLKDCLRWLHERRIPLACLWPFSPPFYSRLGWAVTDMQYEIEATLRDLPDVGDARGYKMVPLTDYASVMPVHEEWVGTLNLSMRRSSRRWERKLHATPYDFRLLVHKEGYMLWEVNRFRDDGLLRIREWAYLSERALGDGLAVIKQMDSQFAKASWRSPDFEPFLRLINSQPPITIRVAQGMMSRVVHVDAFREALPVKFPKISIIDPLDISSTTNGGAEVGPGELVQLVTGFWKKPPSHLPQDLNGVASGIPAFATEDY